MTSFFSIQYYSPFLVLIVGLSTFLGLWGLGTAVLHLFRLRLPTPWEQVTAILLGIQTLSLAVQLAGMLGIASRYMLSGIWWSLVAIGAATLLFRVSRINTTRSHPRHMSALLPLAIIGAALAINALVALAPSSKIDELYYHMLIPSRIVSDGALRFYREPWEGAIWPQMVFQISAAPAHAIGYPDAINIVSWAVSATMLWFAWRIIRIHANSIPWTAFCTASLCVGLYPAVWHVTGGAHAMGDLALAAAIVAFCNRETLRVSLEPTTYAALLSVLLLSASTSKISLLPVCVILLCVAVWLPFRLAPPRAQLRIALAALLPWIVFYGPITWWTWAHSGSPFGPVLATLFNSSVYPRAWLQQTFQNTRDANQIPLFMIRNAVLGYSPLIWVGAIGTLLSANLEKATRAILACLVALQCILVFWFLPYDLRFLSIHYGLFIVFASLGARAIQHRLTSARIMSVVCATFLVPWLGIQIYYAIQFIPVSIGSEKGAFYQCYIAFYSDFLKLDNLLPRDAALLTLGRLSAVYAPRPVFFDPADLPKDKPIALFIWGETTEAGALVANYKLGAVLYENDHAVIKTFRTPGRAPVIGPLKVIDLIKD